MGLPSATLFSNGVEVYRDDVDWKDALTVELLHIARKVPPRKDPAMDRRVERLHSPSENLWRARDFSDTLYRNGSRLEHFGSTSARDNFIAAVRETARKLRQTSLIGHAQERTFSHDGRFYSGGRRRIRAYSGRIDIR